MYRPFSKGIVMVKAIEKVTAFITRKINSGHQLLLLEHPYAGIQIPAGTVEPSESPEEAVLREAFEETGLTISSLPVPLGCQVTRLPPEEAVILAPATVYARPDATSFDWIEIRSAVQVKLLRKVTGFTQISYIEHDQVPDPNYISMQITGWVLDKYLVQVRKRHFFHLKYQGPAKIRWTVSSDQHIFNLFWASWENLPGIIPPQDGWLAYIRKFFEEER
jgi:8-oxo-dGTP pyrophosphatase MutT (NUDIX family)